jgi:glycosyltransferase involved in cell wall biosynthesis
MTDELFEKYPRYPFVVGTEMLRGLCRLAGLEVVDEPDSPAWRFLARKEPAKHPATEAVLLDSIARLRMAGKSRRRFAVVAPMPPAETGIANATIQTYKGYVGGVDIFTRFEDAYGYAALTTAAMGSELGFEVYDIASLPLAIENRDYEAIVITIGNSHHNRFIATLLSTLVAFPPPCPVFLHLHDPWLHDIWAWTALSRGRSAAIDLATIYGGPRRAKFDRQAASQIGALGVAAVISNAPIAGIFVNSAAAEKMVGRELSLAKSIVPIIRGFHPVFPPLVPVPLDRPAGSPLIVGTFGVPGYSKRTEIVYAAVKHLNERGLAVKLLIAGFGISQYLDHQRRFDRSIIRAVDAPSDHDLQALMGEVDVAVQLRREGLGESSGVVPQLLALERPVVVSSIGSFVDFGEAVVAVDARSSVDVVAAAILRATEERDRLRRMSRAYRETRTPARFMRLLESTIATAEAAPARFNRPG